MSKRNQEQRILHRPEDPAAMPAQPGHEETDKEMFLTIADDAMEAGRIASLLKADDIPCIIQSRGIGKLMELLMGNSATGYELYVPAAAIERAYQLIGQENEQEAETLDQDHVVQTDADWEREQQKTQQEDDEAMDALASWIRVFLIVAMAATAVIGIVVVLLFFGR